METTSAGSKKVSAAVGRWAGSRFEAATGQERIMAARAAAESRSSEGRASLMSVAVVALPLSDAQMSKLAAIASPLANGADWSEAMRVLLELGVGVSVAGRLLGVGHPSEASRLAKMAVWPSAMLGLAREWGLTLHHMRWLDGMPFDAARDVIARAQEAQRGVRKDGGDGELTVAAIRDAAMRWAKGKRSEATAGGSTLPSPAEDPTQGGALEADAPAPGVEWEVATEESQRISGLTGADVRVLWAGSQVVLEATYFGAGDLANILEQLSRGHGEAPDHARKRVLRLELDSFDELEYLAGRAEE